MGLSADRGGLEHIVVFVAAHPGHSRSRLATLMGVRRGPGVLDRALASEQIHYADSAVRTRGGALRSVRGLYPGPPKLPEVLFSEPATSGHQLRNLRTRAGVSPGALAYHLGVSRPLVSHWEADRQPMPPWVTERLVDALEAAQTPRPRRRTDSRRLRALLQAANRQPGQSRYALGVCSGRGRAVLEQALAAGYVHEAPAWTARSRQPVVGIFPGPQPKDASMPLLIADLREARLAAGWSHLAMGRHIGIAGTTLARWERELEEVPGWKAEAATAALATARAARSDDRGAILAALSAEPGLSRKSLLARLNYSQHANRIHAELDALIAAGLAVERHAGHHGQQRGVWPGPTQAVVLTPEQLRELRGSRGLEQRALAEQLGTHVQAIRDWEGAHRPMSLEWQQRLRENLEAMPDVREQLRCDVLAALPRNLRQLDLLGLAGHAELRALLQELIDAGRAHEGLVQAVNAAGVSQRRRGYLPGPGT